MTTVSKNTSSTWPLWQRVLFRYWFNYLFLYLFPFPFSAIPLLNLIAVPWDIFVRTLINISASYFFHVQPDWSSTATGSGDQLIRWLELGTYAACALPIAIAWSALDRKRPNYNFLFTLLSMWALMFVSSNMLSYGAAKIIPSQFPPLSDSVLGDTVGSKSPMGILWTFMSASQPYTIFAGFAEFGAGLLLAIPTTRVLGALLCASVGLEVVMLNMCYDVPVKILSGHLLLLSLFLLLPDAKNLFDIFCRRRAGKAFPALDLFRRRRFNTAAWCAMWVFLAYYATFAFISSYGSYKRMANVEARVGDVKGFWYVDSYEYPGQPASVKTPADERWQSVWVYNKTFSAKYGDSWSNFVYTSGANGMDIDLVAKTDNNWKAHFTGQMPDAYHWILRGDACGAPCEVHLHRTNRSEYLILNRGFHWVNEVPYNR